MTLLTTPLETPAQARARELVAGIQGTKRAILGELRHNVSLLWDYPDPQEVLDVLGPQAAELFALNTHFAGFIGQMLAQAGDAAGLAELDAITGKVRPSTVHADGTVTIDPEPVPEPVGE